MVSDSEGNFYGTTLAGGAGFGFGTVFKLSAKGEKTILYSFQGGTDGGSPYAGVVRDEDGNLYGTAEVGGNLGCVEFGCGVVYKITP